MEWEARSFASLVFFSWLGTLQYLRFIKSTSGFLQLIMDSIRDLTVPIGLFCFLEVMFTNSFYMFKVMLGGGVREEYFGQFWIKTLSKQLMAAFGDFADHEKFNTLEWILFVLSLLMVLLLVMNLAIAKMSETLTNWTNTKDRSEYQIKAGLIREMESIQLWKRDECCRPCKKRCKKEGDEEEQQMMHLVFVEETETKLTEETLSDVTNAVKKSVKKES